MRMLGILLLGIGSVYFACALMLFFFQSRLVHLPHVPGRELVATPAERGLPFESLALLTADGVRLHGWFIPAPQARRTLLFFHGNAGNISHRLDSLEIFHRLGLNTLIFDYRGYGRSQGTPSEPGLYRDAEAALAYLQRERGIPRQEIILFGRSLGGAVAAWLAARHPPGALIVESGFTSVPDMAAELYGFFPVRWLARLRYDTLNSLRAVCSPVLIIHSPNDEIIPFEHGRRLFAAAREPKRFLEIHGDHNSGFLQSGRHYEQGFREFLETVSAPAVNPACRED